MTNSELRLATADDIRDWYGRIPYTMHCMLLMIDDHPMAIGGIARMNGQNVAFMDIKPAAQHYPVTLVKASKCVIDEIISRSVVQSVATPDPNLKNSRKFLTKLGFQQLNEELMIWHH